MQTEIIIAGFGGQGVLFAGQPDFPISFLHWYHLVVTYDGANAMFYINGVGHGPYAVNYAPAVGSDHRGDAFCPCRPVVRLRRSSLFYVPRSDEVRG